MSKRTFGWALLALMLLIGTVPRVADSAAQDDPTAEAGEGSSRYFPEAAALGEEWTQERTSGLQVPSDVFREGAIAIYSGPASARAVVLVFLATDSRVAVRQSWELATETFDEYRYQVAVDYDYELEERLEGLEPPMGCVEAKRVEGSDRGFGFLAGITMCAIDPDVILLAIVTGSLGDESGYAASDALVGTALTHAGT